MIKKYSEFNIKENFNLNTLDKFMKFGGEIYVKVKGRVDFKTKKPKLYRVYDMSVKDIHSGTLRIKDGKAEFDIQHDDIMGVVTGKELQQMKSDEQRKKILGESVLEDFSPEPMEGFINETDEGLLQRVSSTYEKTTVGVAFIYRDKVLMVHPRMRYSKDLSMRIERNYWTLPKGEMDKSENFRQAAVREVSEEIGITVDPSKLESDVYESHYESNRGFLKGFLIYTYKINSLSEIGLDEEIVPQDQLETWEVNHAEFFTKQYANYHGDERMKSVINNLEF